MEIHAFRLKQNCFFVLLAMLFFPGPVWAVQGHGGAEGLVSHQLGHLLFFFGMAFLLWQVRKRKWRGSGWKNFVGFLYCILLWNTLTFTGHWLREIVERNHFIVSKGKTIAYQITSLTDLIFYLSRLDHLVLVPAFMFLALALYRWRQQS